MSLLLLIPIRQDTSPIITDGSHLSAALAQLLVWFEVDHKALSEASLKEWPVTMGPTARTDTGRTHIVQTAVEQPNNGFISELRNFFQRITSVGVYFDRLDTELQCTDDDRSVPDSQDTNSVHGCAGGSGSGVPATDREYYNIVLEIMQTVPRGALWAAVHRDPAVRVAFAPCDGESFVAAKLGTKSSITGTIDAASLRMLTLILQVATSEMSRDAPRPAPTAS